LLVVL